MREIYIEKLTATDNWLEVSKREGQGSCENTDIGGFIGSGLGPTLLLEFQVTVFICIV